MVIEILTIICTPFLSVLGIIITQRCTNKRQEKEIKAKEDSEMDARFDAIEKNHKESIDTLSKEYHAELNEIKESISGLKDDVKEIKASNDNTVNIITLKLENLTDKVEKHNSVVERTYKLEQDVAVLTNREKVSENRLKDIENGKKKND